jgi:hypothetical protein
MLVNPSRGRKDVSEELERGEELVRISSHSSSRIRKSGPLIGSSNCWFRSRPINLERQSDRRLPPYVQPNAVALCIMTHESRVMRRAVTPGHETWLTTTVP